MKTHSAFLSATMVLCTQAVAQSGQANPFQDSTPAAYAALMRRVAQRDDARQLDSIIESDAKAVRLATGMKFTEGPLWITSPPTDTTALGSLIFSDIPSDAVMNWSSSDLPEGAKPDLPQLSESEASVYLQPSGYANGLALWIDMPRRGTPEFDAAMQSGGKPPTRYLILAQHTGKIARMSFTDKAAPLVILAEKYDGKSLNSPNDLCMKSDGSIYFTDPPYGLRGLGPKGRAKELDFCGIYRITFTDNKPDAPVLTLLDKSMPTPNGIAFSPDEKTLYVSDTSKGELRAFAVKPDGTLEAGKLLADVKRENEEGPPKSAGADGVKVDTQGNIYVAAAGGVWVFNSSGTKLGIIPIPEGPSNLCFGGPNRTTLFVTARSSVYAVPVKIPGR